MSRRWTQCKTSEWRGQIHYMTTLERYSIKYAANKRLFQRYWRINCCEMLLRFPIRFVSIPFVKQVVSFVKPRCSVYLLPEQFPFSSLWKLHSSPGVLRSVVRPCWGGWVVERIPKNRPCIWPQRKWRRFLSKRANIFMNLITYVGDNPYQKSSSTLKKTGSNGLG